LFIPIFGVTPAATSEDQAQTSARLGGNVEADLESFARRQRQEQTGAVIRLLDSPAVE
jgi:hypothetical protein